MTDGTNSFQEYDDSMLGAEDKDESQSTAGAHKDVRSKLKKSPLPEHIGSKMKKTHYLLVPAQVKAKSQ